MKIYLTLVVVAAQLSMVAGQALAQTFEEEVGPKADDTIRSACHGYNTEHLSEKTKKFYYDKLSGLCKPIPEPSAEYEFPSRPERDKTPHKWVERESDAHIEVPCNGDYFCIKFRKRYFDSDNPVTQDAFDRVKAHCDGESWCIEQWFQTWPRELPAKKTPQKAQGVNIDDLMEESVEIERLVETSSSNQGASIDDLMGGQYAIESNAPSFDDAQRAASGAYAPQTSMDDIFEARNEIQTDKAKSALMEKLNLISAKCGCVKAKGGCFEGPSFNEANVSNSMRKVEKQLHSHKSKLCYDWRGIVQSGIPHDKAKLENYKARAENSLVVLAKMDEQFDKSVGQHRSENTRIARARESQNNSGGFQWGKFAALGVGAAIGGIGNLDSATQVDLISGMVQDSMAGVEGTSNFEGSANARLSELSNQYDFDVNRASSAPTPVEKKRSQGIESLGNLKLACDNPKTQTCMEITYRKKSDYDNALNQCRSYGDSMVVNSCRPSAHCLSTSFNGNIARRFDYDLSADKVELNCVNAGGKFIN